MVAHCQHSRNGVGDSESQAPCVERLAMLPQELRTVAFHAAFSTIVADGSLDVSHKIKTMRADVTRVLELHLATLTSLQRLHLVDNHIGDKGMKALAPHIAKLSSLQQPVLSGVGLGEEGASELGPMLATLTSLSRFRMKYNSIGDKGQQHLRLTSPASPTCVT